LRITGPAVFARATCPCLYGYRVTGLPSIRAQK